MSTSQPMDEGRMFPQPPSQPSALKQQVIALSQSYPCPRCTPGVLEPYGHTETMLCNSCRRSFVPLRGGRLLYPAHTMGWKIAPTFWWDGYRWHWGGTTATARQLTTIVLLSLLPVMSILYVNQAHANWWAQSLPHWCDPVLLACLVWLVAIQVMYFFCWDFEFYTRRRR